MRPLRRVTLSLALTIAPILGSGCASLIPRSVASRPNTRAELKMNAARLEENRGNLLEAKKLYAEVHQLDPQNGDCSYRLALICTVLNQHAEAEVFYRQAYAINANNPNLLADMGYSAFMRKDYVESEKLLEQSVRLNPQNRGAVTNLAIARAWLGKDESSLATFRCVVSESESQQNLASIQYARGDRELGRKNYELAMGQTGQQPTTGTASVAAAGASNGESVPAPAISMQPALQPPISQVAVDTHVAVELPSPAAIAETSLTLVDDGILSISITELADAPPTRSAPRAILAPGEQGDTTTIELISSMTSSPGVIDVPVTTVSVWEAHRDSHETKPQSTPPKLIEATESTEFVVPTKEVARQRSNSQAWRTTSGESGRVDAKIVLTASDSSGGLDPQIDLTDLKTICLVALTEERKLVRSLPEFTMEYQSQPYRFSSAAALAKFKEDPKRFVPAVGGLDIVSFRTEQGVVQGSLRLAIWYRHRLYVFSSRENLEAFRRAPQKFAGDE